MNCFISYTQADLSWAEWIAWQLEESGLQTVLQAWDFRAGSNFILEMDSASKQAQRTLAVLSASYINAAYTHPEWASAVARDPTGKARALLPVRVEECALTGLLAQVVYIDLVGLTEVEAKRRLVSQVYGERGKPLAAPRFPGGSSGEAIEAPPYPPADAAAAQTPAPIASAPLIIGKERELLRKAEQDLLSYVGPVAKILVRRAFAKAATKADLYAELAAAIPTESERQKFLGLATDRPGTSTLLSRGLSGGSQHRHLDTFSVSLLEQLRRELTVHIGPVANLAIDEELGSATTLEDLYRRLGEHIPAGAERLAFLERLPKAC